jgi:carbamoylphosphate synthase small subunit
MVLEKKVEMLSTGVWITTNKQQIVVLTFPHLTNKTTNHLRGEEMILRWPGMIVKVATTLLRSKSDSNRIE